MRYNEEYYNQDEDGLFIEDPYGRLIPNPEYDTSKPSKEKITQLELEL